MQNFLEKYIDSSISFQQLLRDYPKTNVHGRALPILFGYYNFRELFGKKKAFLLDGAVCLMAKGKNRIIYYDTSKQFDFSLLSDKTEILSSSNIEISGFKKNPVEELIYVLDDIFEDKNYRNAKDRAKNRNYPINLMKKGNFTSVELTSENILDVQMIHQKWKEYKLNDPKVFKMTFSGQKYWTLITDYIYYLKDFFDAFVRYGIVDDKQFSVECDYIWGDCAFAMSSFNLFWEFPSNYSEGSRLMFFDELRKRGIKYFNYGFVLNKDLKKYKKHWPSQKVFLYRYTNY